MLVFVAWRPSVPYAELFCHLFPMVSMLKNASVLGLSVMSALMLGACTAATTDGDESLSSSSAAMMDNLSPSADTSVDIDFERSSSSVAQATATSAAAPASQTRAIDVTVANWSFSPATITAKKGEKVQLRITGGTGIHSFAVADLGINVRIEPGQTVTVDLPTDKTGTFGVRCRIPCGEGHQTMSSTVVISE